MLRKYFICLFLFSVMQLPYGTLAVPSSEESSTKMPAKPAKAAIGIVDYVTVKSLTSDPNTLIIDVREPEELAATGQIPSSINIPLKSVLSELDPKVPAENFKQKYGRDKPQLNTQLVIYCRSGRRAQTAAEEAVSLGYNNVKNYKGSWIDWAEHEGLPQ